MRMRLLVLLVAVAVLVLVLPGTALAHHMGRGYGSAPDIVDNYAHGANAASGDAVGSPMSDPDMSPPTGEDSGGYGGPTEDGVNGPQDDVPGMFDGTGGPSGGSMM